MAEVMLVGEPMVMFYAAEYGTLAEVNHFNKGLAGAEVNVGIGLSRLGHQVSYLTKLSTDKMGEYIHNYLKKEKMASEYILKDDNLPVGVMYKNKVKTGDPDTLYYRKGSAASTLSVSDVEKIDFNEFKILHVTGIPAALSLSCREACFYMIKQARKSGCLVTFDPNLRPSLWESDAVMIETINELAALSDMFLPGLAEAQLLSGLIEMDEIADYYLSQGIQDIIIKNGADGAFLKSKGSQSKTISGFNVENVIDTVGAGDGFAVGIIDGMLRGVSLEEAILNANAIGAIQVQHASDNEALPTVAELDTFKLQYR